MDNSIFIIICFAVIFLIVLYAPKIYKTDYIWKCVNMAYNNKTSAKIIRVGKMGDIRTKKGDTDEHNE